MGSRNPFGFTPGPVTFWTIVVYVAFLFPLVYIHESDPINPSPLNLYPGINLEEAWRDLTAISRNYHPYNSDENEGTREYLLKRTEDILKANEVGYTIEQSGGKIWSKDFSSRHDAIDTPSPNIERRSAGPAATIFDDMISNVTWANTLSTIGTKLPGKTFGSGRYFEGTNILCYVRGTEDEDGEWWKNGSNDGTQVPGKGGVLVNAHYDSVSTGYGATDDGMGVVSVLQMISYFTTPGNQPKRGIVFVLNNGEEDGLLGAVAFVYSPLFPFTTTFLNLEGAGAGGRAILFRTSDLEVTKAFYSTPDPFGSVAASDGFKMGIVKSGTDYSIWHDIYGQRGLDLAFYRPRSRYHTNQDDTRHSSPASLWHMLSNAIRATESLSGNTDGTFTGPRPDGDRKKLPSGGASDGVWFDVFGKGFVVFGLRGLFAWSLTLLIVSPLVLFLTTFLLARQDKYYFFSGKVYVHEDEEEDDAVGLGGRKGLFRFPLALGFAGALTIVSAFLIRKINPLIVYSSDYAVWGMMLSLFYVAFWLVSRGASVVRPSALQRGYAHIWLFTIAWAILVIVTVFEDRFRIAAFYPFVFLHSAIFLSTLVTLAELFSLPTKKEFARGVHDDHQIRDNINAVPHADELIAPTPSELENTNSAHSGSDEDEERANETTPLRSGEAGTGQNIRTTFATTYRRSISAIMNGSDKIKERHQPFEHEQSWSGKLTTWTWFIQLLLLAPVTLILFGQVGLFVTASTQYNGANGPNDAILPYLAIAAFSILLLLPLTPFIHRVTYRVPLLLLAIFVGSLIYNLVAFPFSANNRYKVIFRQDLDLDNGTNTVHIIGLEKYVKQMIAELPTAAGQKQSCVSSWPSGLADCTYDGDSVPPRVAGETAKRGFAADPYSGLISINVSRPDSKVNRAILQIDAVNTKQCTLEFQRPVHGFVVHGGADIDPRFGRFPEDGISTAQLWRRDRSKPWNVTIEWKDPPSTNDAGETVSSAAPSDQRDQSELKARGHRAGVVEQTLVPYTSHSGVEGKIMCSWSDANDAETIPAFTECLQFSPDWIAVTKGAVGLVEGRKQFLL